MRRIVPVVACVLVALLTAPAWNRERERPGGTTSLRFEVTVAKGLLSGPTDGRVLLVLARQASPEPRFVLSSYTLPKTPFLGRDANGLKPGDTVTLDRSAAIFPLASLDQLPKGEYHVQAVFDHNRDLRLPGAPGNLVSEVKQVTLDPAAGGTVTLELSRRLPPEEMPVDTEDVKFLKLRSERLSKFHGRPIYLRAGVVLPPDHAKDKDRQYALRVHIGGFGTRFTAARSFAQARSAFRRASSAEGARMILLHLDGAGPLGDPYQVNSANHGPYGDAITQELIPEVEKRFRGLAKPYARVLDGSSTGGWVSLALQVFYPDFFNGAWSHCPDPVDFRAFELIDVYTDDNAYRNRHGFDRPGMRTINGDVVYTVRHEVAREAVLGRGDRWSLSGLDWCSWNATFSPRGKDGLPVPLWDDKGQIDRKVAEHWKKYDLRLHLQTHWPTLGPKLPDKLRIWVGDADEYFLNNAVHLLDAFLKKAKPPFAGKVTFGPRGGHSWRGLSDREMIDEMAAAIEKGRAEAERR